MKEIRCLVVDDEPPAIRLITKYIERIPFLSLVNSTSDPFESLKIVENENIELVFLDIKMPRITGLQISKIIKGKAKVIFTTAYPDFALESYNLDAVDYILKPFTFERFYEASFKALKDKITNIQIIDNKLYFFVKTGGKFNFEKVFLDEICYVKGLKNYVTINLENRKLIVYSTLKNIEENLSSENFVKIHKSHIVSLKHIEKIDSISVIINGVSLPIGNTFRDFFFDKINQLNLLKNNLNNENFS